jgi:hypothetical protein
VQTGIISTICERFNWARSTIFEGRFTTWIKNRELDLAVDRRAFLYGTAAAVAQAGVAAAFPNPAQRNTGENSTSGGRQQKPNIVIYHSDQFRWDFVGANGLNSSTHTPNLDVLAARGTNFNHAVTN